MNPRSRCTVLWVSAVSHMFGAERSLLAVLKFLPRDSIRSILVCPEGRGGPAPASPSGRRTGELGDEARRVGIDVIHAPVERFRRLAREGRRTVVERFNIRTLITSHEQLVFSICEQKSR